MSAPLPAANAAVHHAFLEMLAELPPFLVIGEVGIRFEGFYQMLQVVPNGQQAIEQFYEMPGDTPTTGARRRVQPTSVPEHGRRHGPGERERDLVARARRGDLAALGELFERHSTQLMVAAWRICRNASDADDVVQDAMLAASTAISQFDGRSSISTWLHRITINAALMFLRRRRRRGEALQRHAGRLRAFPHPRDVVSPTPFAAENLTELSGALRRGVGSLAPAHAEVLTLCDIRGMSPRHAAQTLGVSGATVRTRLHRARRALAAVMTANPSFDRAAPFETQALAG